MKLSVVVPTWNVKAELLAALDALAREVERVAFGVETIVVDDGSTDGSAAAVRAAFPSVRLFVNDENRGFAPAVNRGLAAATGELVLLLNADCELEVGTLAALVAFLDDHPNYAAAAPELCDPDGAPQASCMRFPKLWTPLFHGGPLERVWPRSPELRRYFATGLPSGVDVDVEQPPAACLAVRRAALDELGGLAEDLCVFFNDVDLCRRLAERGGRIRRLGGARARHAVGRSTAQLPDFAGRWHTDRYRYHRRHFGVLGGAVAKLGTLGAYCDFALVQFTFRLRGRPSEPLGPRARALWSFLVRGAA